MAKHLIVCGHGAGDPGAGGNGINERDWTRNSLKPLMEKWAKLLKNNTIEFYPVANNMFVDTQRGWGAYAVNANSVTEIHLDSASAAATGGHAIIHTALTPDQNDLAIAQVIKKYVGWWGSVQHSQGINKRNNLLNCNVFVTRPGISYRLIELGFISNPTDVANLQKNIDAVAKELVEAITGEKISSGASSTQPNKKNQKEGVIMLLFAENRTVYWLVGNKYTPVRNPADLSKIENMMKQAGYDTHLHTDKDQIRYIKKIAEFS